MPKIDICLEEMLEIVASLKTAAYYLEECDSKESVRLKILAQNISNRFINSECMEVKS